MKKIIALFIVLMMFGCGNQNQSKQIVVTSFIGYDAVKHINPSDEITNILPWGIELHDFEPTPQDITMIEEAGVFFYVSDAMDPWIKQLKTKQNVFALESFVKENKSMTQHFWSDPLQYIEIIKGVENQLSEWNVDMKTKYEANMKTYIDEILAIHKEFDTYIKTQETPTIFFAGHNAMGDFAKRYGIEIVALIDEEQPDADIRANQIIDMKKALKDANAHILFIEELEEPKVALQIQKELKDEGYTIELLELHSYHNITKQQFEEGLSYAQLFKRNTEYIRKALTH